jgi:hypothetical protein
LRGCLLPLPWLALELLRLPVLPLPRCLLPLPRLARELLPWSLL